MALTGEEIRARLAAFAARWSVYSGSERSEAQTFLNGLFACYGQDREAVARFEEPQQGRFVDLIWPRVCLFEMKAPSEADRLARHRAQALRYWAEAADEAAGVPSPEFVVICAFRRLEIWQPGRFPREPRAALDLIDLPDQYDALLFLAGGQPMFVGGQAAVTRKAVAELTGLYAELRERKAAPLEVLRDFLLQSVWCMFAEDLGQIPGHRFTEIVERLLGDAHRSSADDLGQLFRWLSTRGDRPEHGMYSGVPYVNGSLFSEPAQVHLDRNELERLRDVSNFKWRSVEPQIFGSLLEGALGHEKQWELGAHYTHEADIQKVVQPTIVAPWRERIEALSTHAEATAAQHELMNYVVLDPACGSGNFLYVAYRELRRLEQRLRERERELSRRAGLRNQEALSLFFPLANIRGIELDSFAVNLARVTLWMGHKLAVDELDLDERTLPLVDLSGIQTADALRVPWPQAAAIIGNPPFHGSQNMREVLGNDYVEWLKRAFGVGIKDYCVYWFRKAHDQLPPGGRAGLVGTNSVSQNRARSASLNYVASRGGVITYAVSKQKWPGEAVVNVSIVNWVKQPVDPPERFLLDAVEVAGISTALRESTLPIEHVAPLPANRGRSFQGAIPVGTFYLSPDEAREILDDDPRYAAVVRPYLVGDDITEDPEQRPRRFVIDFAELPLEQAMLYPRALDLVRTRVKPERERNNDEGFRRLWWRFGRPRPAMRTAIAGLPRYIAGNAQGKRFLFCWVDESVCPSNLTNVFAFDDDYAMGVLTSQVHLNWAVHHSSTLRVDLRYTPTSAFETFPWPPATPEQRAGIGALSAELIVRRQAICVERGIGLTTLYNQIDDGAWSDLRDLHERLDAAVAEAYGWPAKVGGSPLESNARLARLNDRIASGELPYDPFGSTAPGQDW